MGVEIIEPDSAEFQAYIETFIQRVPRYGVKGKKGWRSLKKPLKDELVKKHLEQQRIVGVLAKWYPEYTIIDIDDRSPDFVDELRDEMGLDKANSMLMTSESPDSYHLLFKPSIEGKPPTRYKLNESLKTFVKQKGVELYPQSRCLVRLPFGKFQKCLDMEEPFLNTWDAKLYWFHKLEPFDLGEVPAQQFGFDFTIIPDHRLPLVGYGSSGWFQAGAELFQHGLQEPRSRHESQARVIYWLFRQDVLPSEVVSQTFAWIKKRHNGLSEDIRKYPAAVRKEIERQVNWFYSNYTWGDIYPDSTHNRFNGYITKPDIQDIANICQGSIPRMRFLFELVKYSYPRRYRRYINIHSDKLIQWSSKGTYRDYLNELESGGIASRGKGYVSGVFSKHLRLNWKYRNPEQAVLFSGRSIDTLEGTIKTAFNPQDARSLLLAGGMDKGQVSRYLKRVYG